MHNLHVSSNTLTHFAERINIVPNGIFHAWLFGYFFNRTGINLKMSFVLK